MIECAFPISEPCLLCDDALEADPRWRLLCKSEKLYDRKINRVRQKFADRFDRHVMGCKECCSHDEDPFDICDEAVRLVTLSVIWEPLAVALLRRLWKFNFWGSLWERIPRFL